MFVSFAVALDGRHEMGYSYTNAVPSYTVTGSQQYDVSINPGADRDVTDGSVSETYGIVQLPTLFNGVEDHTLLVAGVRDLLRIADASAGRDARLQALVCQTLLRSQMSRRKSTIASFSVSCPTSGPIPRRLLPNAMSGDRDPAFEVARPLGSVDVNGVANSGRSESDSGVMA